MARVMIRCPESDKPVYTGLNFEWPCFDSVQLGEKSIRCRECGEVHLWRRTDAYLDDDGGEA